MAPTGGAKNTGGAATSGGSNAGGRTALAGGATATGGTTSTGGATCQSKSRDCTSSLDSDCNGTPDNQETAYCQCPSGQTQSCLLAGMCTAGSQACATSSDKSSTAWGSCTGYTGPTTLYRDADGDGYGNPSQPAQVCPGTLGYVTNAEDCDDSDPNFKPGVTICSTVTQKKSCVGGTPVLQPCDQGCIYGNCRSDGTIGLPGYVSCTATHVPRCAASDGCDLYYGTCGATGASSVACDGPGDCATGQSCCARSFPGGAQTLCISGACAGPNSNEYQVCDPLANTCTCASTNIGGYLFNVCTS